MITKILRVAAMIFTNLQPKVLFDAIHIGLQIEDCVQDAILPKITLM